MRAIRSFAKCCRGASVAEFTFVILPMTAFVFGVVQFGGILFIHNDIQNAARDAARRMAAGPMCFVGGTIKCGSQPANYVEDFACGYLGGLAPVVEVMVSETDTADGTDMKVAVQSDMGAAAIVDMFGMFEGRTLSAEAILRREYEPETPPPPCP